MGAIAIGGMNAATMSSREIAELCEARHNDVVATIQRLFEQGVLRESRKTTRTLAPEGGGRPTQIFDLTKRDTLVVVSGYSADLRARIIDRWQELEAAQRPDPMTALNDPAMMRGLLLTYTEKVLALEAENAALAPKAEALDRIASADGSLNVTAAAKALQMPPKALFGWLQANKWLYRRPGGGSLLGYQDRVQQGLIEHKVTTVQRGDGSEKIVEQALITAKGLAKLASAMTPSRLN